MIRAICTTICLGMLASACASSAIVVVDEPELTPAPVAEAPEYRRLQRIDIRPLIIEPPAARQIREGYWLGAMIEPIHVPWLSRAGIHVVLSAVNPSDKTVEILEQWGIEQVSVPMGSSFRHTEIILEVVESHEPAEIFIHCRHGADRTGAIAAFLLVVRHGWPIPDAFYSVLYNHEDDIDGLSDVLEDYGFVDTRIVDDPSVGFYSVSAAGQIGGLKARNRRYTRLISTTLDAILAFFGPPELES